MEEVVLRKGIAVIITIDGPAGSGKSTVARQLAKELGCRYLNTGAMYRALTLQVIEKHKDPDDETACARLAQGMVFDIVSPGGDPVLLLNGSPVSGRIQSEEVDGMVSLVSRHPSVRDIMLMKQRGLACSGSIVVEGRDVGTRVFPDAPVKIFVTASIGERARRRYNEYRQKGMADADLGSIEAMIKERDELDSKRKHSPLSVAADAVVLDTTGMSVKEQLDKALQIVRSRGNP